MLLTGTDARATYLNPAWLELVGRDLAESLGTRWLEAFTPGDASRLRQLLGRNQQAGRPSGFSLELTIATGGGSRRSILLAARPATSAPDLPATWAVSAADVTSLRSALDHLYDLATHDPLTGMLNRMELFEQARLALTRMERRMTTTAALFIDFDDFKAVNDRLGHESGDLVLAALAKRLRASVRGADHLGRYGGDEFVAVCEDLRDETEAMAIAARLVRESATPVMVGDEAVALTASIGVAIARQPEDSAETVINRADQAMYIAKQQGNVFVLAPSPG
jgi:diguanylate cyclase (GGDEF)-like protein/PAS domain S-box-containing protein